MEFNVFVISSENENFTVISLVACVEGAEINTFAFPVIWFFIVVDTIGM